MTDTWRLVQITDKGQRKVLETNIPPENRKEREAYWNQRLHPTNDRIRLEQENPHA